MTEYCVWRIWDRMSLDEAVRDEPAMRLCAEGAERAAVKFREECIDDFEHPDIIRVFVAWRLSPIEGKVFEVEREAVPVYSAREVKHGQG